MNVFSRNILRAASFLNKTKTKQHLHFIQISALLEKSLTRCRSFSWDQNRKKPLKYLCTLMPLLHRKTKFYHDHINIVDNEECREIFSLCT